MPELHRGAVVYLEWDLTLDEPLTGTPAVAIYKKGTAPELVWTPLEWTGEERVANGLHTRTARLLVAGEDAEAPPPQALVLGVGKWVNHTRVGIGTTERPVGPGEVISVTR